nr:unnamed protein product [Digitaria exilis]
MPGRRDHGDGVEPSPYVLMLREHEDAGRGYSLELAPLPGGGAAPRAHHGRGWTTEAPTAAAEGTSPRDRSGSSTEASTTTAGAGNASRSHAHGSSRWRAAGTGTAPPTREAATRTGGVTGSRADGSSPTRKAAAARLPRARDRGTAVEVGTGSPRVRGGRTATDGGAASPRRGDAADKNDHGEYDPTAAAREEILEEMREMIFGRATLEEQFDIIDAESKISDDIKNIREVLIPVFLSPKKKRKDDKAKVANELNAIIEYFTNFVDMLLQDDIWNKRQLIYGIALLGPLGIVPAIVAIMPQWVVFTFAVGWGLGSVGFPLGLYGNSRLETGYSRHMARLVFMGFSLLVIYTLYQYMTLAGSSSPSAPPPVADMLPSPAADMLPPHADTMWTVAFGILGVIVLAGHILSWVRGCWTGSDSDRDESESSEDENPSTSRLLGRY